MALAIFVMGCFGCNLHTDESPPLPTQDAAAPSVLVEMVDQASTSTSSAVTGPLVDTKAKRHPYDNNGNLEKATQLAMTWDGRLIFNVKNRAKNVFTCSSAGPVLQSDKVQQIEVSLLGIDDVKIVNQQVTLPAPDASQAINHQNGSDSNIVISNADIAVSQNPTIESEYGNPYRCSIGNTPNHTGEYDCYDLMFVVAVRDVSCDANQNVQLSVREIYQISSRVRVQKSSSIIDEFVIEPDVSQWLPVKYSSATGGLEHMNGQEPSLTADGRLMIVGTQYLYNDYVAGSNVPMNESWSEPRQVVNINNEDRVFNSLLCSNEAVECQARFRERYPIAREPMRNAKGELCTCAPNPNPNASNSEVCTCFGPYPWISQDGSEIFFTRFTDASEIPNNGKRHGLHVVGLRTNFTEMFIDGPLNFNAEDQITTSSGMIVSPGLTWSMWHPYPETERHRPFTRAKSRAVYPVFGGGHYGEVWFDPWMDDDVILYLPMTPYTEFGLNIENQGQWAYLGKGKIFGSETVDISGYFNEVTLGQGSVFSVEKAKMPGGNWDDYRGYHGNGVFVPLGSDVSVALGPEAGVYHDSMTFALAFRYVDSGGIYGDFDVFRFGNFHVRYRRQAGAKMIMVGYDDNDNFDLSVPGDSSGIDCEASFCHITVVHDASAGVRIYVNGQLGGSSNQAPSLQFGNVIVGPSSCNTASCNPGGGSSSNDGMVVDEVMIARGALSDQDVSKWSFYDEIESGAEVSLPVEEALQLVLANGSLQYDAADVFLPEEINDLFASAADNQVGAMRLLGELLFKTQSLSLGGTVSCSSCHSSNTLSDNGVQFSTLANNSPAARHTPVAFNRIFSTAQGWIGSEPSLAEQAIAPFAVDHMIDDSTVIAKLCDLSPENYFALLWEDVWPDESLSDLCSNPQNQQTVFERVRWLLTLYLAAQIRWGTDPQFVRHMSQDPSNPPEQDAARRGEALFHGKARCVGCHAGPRFTDERFHTLRVSPTDDGRMEITGRAQDDGAFKTPTLLHIKDTAPYFHDGSRSTLTEVVEFYNTGAGVAWNNGSPDPMFNLDPELQPLHLTPSEIADLVAYLEKL